MPPGVPTPSAPDSTTTSTGFDPLTATASERFIRFSQLIVQYGGEGAMTETDALSVAGNFCDNSVDDMKNYLSALQTVYPSEQVIANAAALADAYCPNQRVVVEGAMNELGIDTQLPGG